MWSENYARGKADIPFRLFIHTNQTFLPIAYYAASLFFSQESKEENQNFMLDM
jgi:hypothetical protein